MPRKGSWVGLLAAGLALAACSVSVPRGGWSNLRSGAASPGNSGGSPTAAGEPGSSSAGSSVAGLAGSSQGLASASGGSSVGSDLGGGTASSPTGGSAGTTSGASSQPAGSQSTSAPGDSTGVTSNSIKISFLAQFSGTTGPIISNWYDTGWGTWVDYVNSHGGINGRQIESIKIDHMDTPEGGVAACKAVEANGSFMAVVGEGVNGHLPAIQCLDQAHVPVLYNYSDPRLSSGLRTAYTMLAGFDDAGKIALPGFIKNYLHDGSKGIGVLYRSDSPVYSTAAMDFEAAAKAVGLRIVDTETVTSSQSDYTPEILHLQSSHAGVAAVFGDTEITTAVRDAKSVGYSPDWVGPPSWSVDTFGAISPGLLNGIKTIRAITTANSPAYQQFAAEAQAEGKTGLVPDELFFYTYGVIAGAALQRAGRDLTRQSFLAAVRSMTGFNPQVSPPLDWSATNMKGTSAVYPVQCCDSQNRWIGLGPPQSTF